MIQNSANQETLEMTTSAHVPLKRGLPAITQIAYLVEDLNTAVEFWARCLNVGPFKVLPHLKFSEGEYLGKPVEIDISIALAWGNGVQIELMQQHSKGASVFVDHAPRGGGFHHVGIHTDDPRRDEAQLVTSGFRRLQRTVSATGTETIFLGGIPMAGIVELIHTPGGSPLSARLKEAAAAWDGLDPYLP